jgi:hypothetical protein
MNDFAAWAKKWLQERVGYVKQHPGCIWWNLRQVSEKIETAKKQMEFCGMLTAAKTDLASVLANIKKSAAQHGIPLPDELMDISYIQDYPVEPWAEVRELAAKVLAELEARKQEFVEAYEQQQAARLQTSLRLI